MIGLGTIINTAAVIAGGLIGICLKKGMKQKMQDTLMQACGVAVIFLGISGTLSKMNVVENSDMVLILSLVIGSFIGEWLDIEEKMDLIGEKIKTAVKAQNDNKFVDGFVNVSLIFCVGVNVGFGKRINVGNMLPALIIAALWAIV